MCQAHARVRTAPNPHRCGALLKRWDSCHGNVVGATIDKSELDAKGAMAQGYGRVHCYDDLLFGPWPYVRWPALKRASWSALKRVRLVGVSAIIGYLKLLSIERYGTTCTINQVQVHLGRAPSIHDLVNGHRQAKFAC